MQKVDFQKLRNDIFKCSVCSMGGDKIYSKKNVIKILSILFIWTVLLTACTDPQNPVENIKKNTYPESLTSQEKENVSAFSTEKLSDSLSSMEKVIELLEIHKDEEGASKNLSLIKDIYVAIKDSGVTGLTNESLDVNAIIKGIEDNADAIQEDIIALDTSYTDENGVTQSYKNADDYNAAREDAIGKIDEYLDYAHGDYWTKLNAYANAVDESYTNRPAYNVVENYAKETVEDFKDNYIFNKSYDEKEIKTFVNNAKTEQENIQNGSGVAEEKAAYDTATVTLGDYETSARDAVNAANSFELVKQDNTTTTPAIENPENNDPINNDPINDNPEVTYTDATITDISQVTDWSKVGNVTVVATPDANGSLDVMSYYNLKKAVDDKVASLSDGHSRTVAFAAYPATVKSFKISMPSDKTNVELMNSIVNPKELEFSGIGSFSTVAEREAKIKKTEVIPGVNLVSYPARYYAKADVDNEIQQAFEFEKNTTVTMPSGKYGLGYNGGIIARNGANLDIQNLANADMEGTIYKENISAIYGKFVSGKSASELPKLSLKLSARVADNYSTEDSNLPFSGVNVYETDIDHIISTYYKNEANNKFNYTSTTEVIFDAREYNGGVMYEENTFKSAYNLDVNAALFFDDIANVNVVGENKTGITDAAFSSITNTRIEADMGGVEFTGEIGGVLDIAGTQSGTLTLPNLGGRVIVRDGAISGGNSSILLHGADQVDLAEVSEENVSKVSTGGNFYGFVNFKNENAANKTSVKGTGNNFYGTENRFGGVSAQQIVERANNGESLNSGISQLSPRKVAPTKSELLPAILDEIV